MGIGLKDGSLGLDQNKHQTTGKSFTPIKTTHAQVHIRGVFGGTLHLALDAIPAGSAISYITG